MRPLLSRLIVGAAMALAAFTTWAALSPNLLWFTVHELCDQDMVLTGSPFPCKRYDAREGVALLSVIGSAAHLLLVPTTRISGLESPLLLQAGAGRYWNDAWQARQLIDTRVGRQLPREYLGMAANSRFGRTQDQLHIHIGCIQPSVQKSVGLFEPQIDTTWTKLPFHLMHHTYWAMRIYGNDLSAQNPVKLLYTDSNAVAVDRVTLAILGETFADGSPGFILIKGYADDRGGYRGFSEELLDYTCQLAIKSTQ